VKGIELPINILVIVAIAVIVLLGIIALYFTGFGPFSGATALEGIKNSACRQLVQTYNCAGTTTAASITITNFDANNDGAINGAVTFGTWGVAANCNAAATSADNLASLCQCRYGRTTEAACRQMCGCPGV
jgi:hypothetical protein